MLNNTMRIESLAQQLHDGYGISTKRENAPLEFQPGDFDSAQRALVTRVARTPARHHDAVACRYSALPLWIT
jgi:hypothetical protein